MGTLIEKDLQAAKEYWRKQPPNPTPRKEKGKAGMPTLAVLSVSLCFDTLTSRAVVDSGSTFSLVSEAMWRKIKAPHEKSLPAEGQAFKLANGKLQTAIGKVKRRCKLNGHQMQHEFYIKKDCDLRFPCILGLDFLAAHQIRVDFGQCSLSLPYADIPVMLSDSTPQAIISLLLAVTPTSVQKDIRTPVEAADFDDGQKPQIFEVLSTWPRQKASLPCPGTQAAAGGGGNKEDAELGPRHGLLQLYWYQKKEEKLAYASTTEH